MVNRTRGQQRTQFVCQECGHESSRWMGFCPSPACGSPLPLQEMEVAVPGAARHGWLPSASEPPQELSTLAPEDNTRLKLPSEELNRVLGGGIVAGSVALLAGEPGVGKSTLLLQLARYLSEGGRQVTYVSGEESPTRSSCARSAWASPAMAFFWLPRPTWTWRWPGLKRAGPVSP